MTRRSASFITFILRFTEPGGVTVPSQPDLSAAWGPARAHLLLDTDPQGRPQLPGTSLAGALREMVRTQRSPELAEVLFGHLAADQDAAGVPSRIWVLGSRPVAQDGSESAIVPSEVRASTKIDRERGAARENTLRIDEVLPAGSRFEVFLRWDDASAGEVEDLAGLLAVWRPFIGRGVSRGRGRCAAERVRHGTLNLDEPEGMLRWLTMNGPNLAHAIAVNDMAAEAHDDEPVLRATLSIRGPWRIGSGEPPPKEAQGDREHEVIPLLKTAAGFLVPGSGLKGLLRSRAEFILRSTGAVPPPCLDQQCENCWICQVFGYGGGKDTESGSVGARSAIRVADSVVGQAEPVRRTHIAIDRFTGGVLDGALYEVEALEAGTFTIQVEQLVTLTEERLTEIRAVLRLVLADLDDGIIGIGAGVARGYGSVKVVPEDGLPSVPEARRVLAGLVRSGAHVPA